MAQRYVAIYSHEWAFADKIPLFNGGLGVLNGCLALSFADLGYTNIILVGVNYRKGLLRQEIMDNWQKNHPADWNPEDKDIGYEKLPIKIKINLYGNEITIGAFRKKIVSEISGKGIDHILLDIDPRENPQGTEEWTDFLYSDRFKLQQNLVLGLGGPAMLEALGYDVGTHHIQEGAAAFVGLHLLNRNGWNVDRAREQCVFTNHTVVSAGMPSFDYGNVRNAIGPLFDHYDVSRLAGEHGFDTNLFAANLSRYINGVSRAHAEIMKGMPQFAGKDVDYITNGVHWRFMSEEMQKLLDEQIGGNWRLHPELLSRAASIDPNLMRAVHTANKNKLVDLVNERGIRSHDFEPDVFTVAYPRRITLYKQPNALLDLLMAIQNTFPGPVQVVYTGKVHRNDGPSHNVLHQILDNGLAQKNIRFAFLPDYGLEFAKIIMPGIDTSVQTARPDLEASATGFMKAGLAGSKTITTDGGAVPEVDGRFGKNAYVFGSEDGYSDFGTVFIQAMHDFFVGRMATDRPGVVAEFGSKFSSVRAAVEYYNQAYGQTPQSAELEERVVSAPT